MKRKYTIKQFLRYWLSKTQVITKDIHAQLEETIAKHNEIKQQWQGFVFPRRSADFF